MNNQNIWRAGTFDDKRRQLRVVSGPRELRWTKLVARVECILESRSRIVAIVAAAGDNPLEPGNHDLVNAQLAALLVHKQMRYRLSRRTIAVYLRFKPYTQVEVEIDIESTVAKVREYFASARGTEQATTIPTPLLSYLLTKQQR